MRRLVADPAYLLHKIFNGDLVAIHITRSKLKLNRPIHVGNQFSTVPSSSFMTPVTTRLRLCTAQGKPALYIHYTDSLLFQVETEDIYADMRESAENMTSATTQRTIRATAQTTRW